MTYIKQIKNYTKGAVTLGVGSAVLGQMGQGQIATAVITPASNMLGVGVTAGMGMGILKQINKQSKKL